MPTISTLDFLKRFWLPGLSLALLSLVLFWEFGASDTRRGGAYSFIPYVKNTEHDCFVTFVFLLELVPSLPAHFQDKQVRDLLPLMDPSHTKLFPTIELVSLKQVQGPLLQYLMLRKVSVIIREYLSSPFWTWTDRTRKLISKYNHASRFLLP